MNKERIIYLGTIIILLIILIFSYRSCTSQKNQIDELSQNVAALRDSTKKMKDLLGRVIYEKNIYLATAENLKKLNAELAKEVDANNETRVVTKVVTILKIDSSYAKNFVNKINDSTFLIIFKHNFFKDSSNYLTFNGSVPVKILVDSLKKVISLSSDSTKISDFDMKLKVFSGIKKDGDKYNVYARTDFPNVSFDVDGAVIDPSKSFTTSNRGVFALVLGPALSVVRINGETSFLPSIGISVGINLINF